MSNTVTTPNKLVLILSWEQVAMLNALLQEASLFARRDHHLEWANALQEVVDTATENTWTDYWDNVRSDSPNDDLQG